MKSVVGILVGKVLALFARAPAVADPKTRTAVSFIVRESRREDAQAVAALFTEFAEYVRSLGEESALVFSAEDYVRDGFGTEPAFRGLVAESDGLVVAYLLYYFGYDVDSATRMVHIADFFVKQPYRRQGIGEALVRRAAKICKDAGGTRLSWYVYAPNRSGIRFYENLGAYRTPELTYMMLDVE